jgi:hypothetical protein
VKAPIRPGDVVRFEPAVRPLSDAWSRRVGREFVVIGEPDGKVPLWDPEFRESGGGAAIYVNPESGVLVARAVPVTNPLMSTVTEWLCREGHTEFRHPTEEAARAHVAGRPGCQLLKRVTTTINVPAGGEQRG